MLAIRQGQISGTGPLASHSVVSSLAPVKPVVGDLCVDRVSASADLKPAVRPDQQALSGNATNRLGKIVAMPKRDIPVQGTGSATLQQAEWNRTNLLASIAQLKQALDSEIQGIASDLKNPTREEEARARLNLVLVQRDGLAMLQSKLEGYRIPGNLSPQGYHQVANMLASVDAGIRDLVNPLPHLMNRRSMEKAFADLASRLGSPRPFVSVPAQGTGQATFRQADLNRTNLLGSIGQLKQALDFELQGIASDLKNPNRVKEAMARMELVLTQRAGLDLVEKKLEGYQIPGNLSPQGYHQVANMLASIDAGIRDLVNPLPHLMNRKRMEKAFTDLASRLG